MLTLHRYILRELLKTFALALIGTTALFTLAGGIYNVVSREGVGTAELFALVPLLIPIFVTFTMPLAALFAVTIVYGRLAADNELVACRAAGINIHRLFLSCFLLSVFVAVCSFALVNFVIPGMVGEMRAYLRRNLAGFAEQQLKTRGSVRYATRSQGIGEREVGDWYYMTAQRVISNFSPDALREKGWNPDLKYLGIEHPVILQVDRHGEVVRFMTARFCLTQFDTRADPISIAGLAQDGRSYEIGRGTVRFEEQPLERLEVVLPIRANLSFLDLADLAEVYAAPWQFTEVADSITRFADALRRYRFAEYCRTRIADGRPLELPRTGGGTYRVTAATCRAPDRDHLFLDDVRVVTEHADPGRPTHYEAPTGVLSIRESRDGDLLLRLSLAGAGENMVRQWHPGSPLFTQVREKHEETLEDLGAPTAVLDQVDSRSPRDLIDPSVDLGLAGTELATKRAKLGQLALTTRREALALFHFRFGFAASAIVTILMGAALGVAFKGGRALAAFGLAAIPLGLIAVLLMMGRNTGERAGGELIGAAITWGGLAAIAIADIIIMRLGVRR